MKNYWDLPQSERGWIYCKDAYAGFEWRWDRAASRLRLIDYKHSLVVDEVIPVSRVFGLGKRSQTSETNTNSEKVEST